MDKPLNRIEYYGSKRKPKKMCENPGRQVGLADKVILKYYIQKRTSQPCLKRHMFKYPD